MDRPVRTRALSRRSAATLKPSINGLLVFIPITLALEHAAELSASLIWFKAQLITVYLIIAMLFYFMPEPQP